MANYVLLYSGATEMPQTQAEIDATMAAWGAWMGGLGDSLVDGGNPVNGSSAKVIAADGTVSPASQEGLQTGYSIISAESIDDAVAKAQGCPIRQAGGNITVLETFEM